MKSITGITYNDKNTCIKELSSFACICKDCEKEIYNKLNKIMKTKTTTKKIKVKSIKPHTNFANEIQSLEQSDKFFNRILWTIGTVVAILGIILLIVNLTK